MTNKKSRHPEPFLFEGARISFNTSPVILSGAFPREDLIFSSFLLYKYFKRWDSHVAQYAPQNDRVGNDFLTSLHSLKAIIKTWLFQKQARLPFSQILPFQIGNKGTSPEAVIDSVILSLHPAVSHLFRSQVRGE
jgi:hypothetical protein